MNRFSLCVQVIKARLSCLEVQHQYQIIKGRMRSHADSLNLLDCDWYQLTRSSINSTKLVCMRGVFILRENVHYLMLAELS